MADRTPADRPRKRALLLSELIGEESAPLPVRKTPEKEDIEEEPLLEEELSPKAEKKHEKREKKEKTRRCVCAYDAAMNILASGDNSEKMLREKLSRKGYGPTEIEDALVLLREDGYVCDRRLMIRYVAMLAEKKFYGEYRIRPELLRRFDRAVVEENFADAVREIDFAEQARIYAEKFAHKGREYLIRRLSYLGYGREQIRLALKALNEAAGD